MSIPSEIVAITHDLFPGPVDAWIESDPEAPGSEFLIVMVHATDDPREITERRLEWHRRVARALPNAEIRLSITSVSSTREDAKTQG